MPPTTVHVGDTTDHCTTFGEKERGRQPVNVDCDRCELSSPDILVRRCPAHQRLRTGFDLEEDGGVELEAGKHDTR